MFFEIDPKDLQPLQQKDENVKKEKTREKVNNAKTTKVLQEKKKEKFLKIQQYVKLYQAQGDKIMFYLNYIFPQTFEITSLFEVNLNKINLMMGKKMLLEINNLIINLSSELNYLKNKKIGQEYWKYFLKSPEYQKLL